jgi:uncharacterized protein YjbI with pentapeptide repeats
VDAECTAAVFDQADLLGASFLRARTPGASWRGVDLGGVVDLSLDEAAA